MKAVAPTWLFLITNLPGRNQTLRMRSWRALKGSGAELLRDGVYVLPDAQPSRQVFTAQAAEIRGAGGAAHIVAFAAESVAQQVELTALFDRGGDYGEAMTQLDAFKGALAKLTEAESRQRIAALGREIAGIAARDFFPGEPRRQVEAALADAESAINARFAPDEPHGAHRRITVREREDYRGRTWATRERLWVDRVASAWLIKRFIDPKARFLWLKKPKDCPKAAVGFDFDAAEFTHIDSRVTFEVLLASFELQADGALTRLAALIHYLDVGGIPVAEAPGFATIMAGARSSQPDDDALLKAMVPVLDSLYAGYRGASASK